MSNSDVIEIQRSQSKLILAFLGSLCFMVLGILFVFKPSWFVTSILRFENVIIVVGIAGIILFGVFDFLLLKSILNKKMGLVISDAGLADHSSYASVEFIPWEDIERVEELSVFNQKFITIILKDSEKYLEQEKNPRKKKLMKTNLRMYGSIANISTNSIQCNHNELKELILERMKNCNSRC